jgi:diaminopimelate decarboxylase
VFGPSWRTLADEAAAPQRDDWWRHRRDDLIALARERSPRYVYSIAHVRKQARALRELPAADRWLYALKANPHPAILRALGEEGFSFECVSMAEVDAVRAAVANVVPEHILFTPNFAPRVEYAAALAAGVLLARVTQTKRKGSVRYVGVDAGMNSLIRPALYEAWHEIVNLSRLDDESGELVQIVGPICESGDVLGSNRRLPVCREGDVILIAQAGAYGAVMASHYNLRAPAEEVVLP